MDRADPYTHMGFEKILGARTLELDSASMSEISRPRYFWCSFELMAHDHWTEHRPKGVERIVIEWPWPESAEWLKIDAVRERFCCPLVEDPRVWLHKVVIELLHRPTMFRGSDIRMESGHAV